MRYALISVEWIQSAQEKPFVVGGGGTSAGGKNLSFDNMKNQGIFSDELEFADFCLLAVAKFPRWLQTVQWQCTLYSGWGERSLCCLESCHHYQDWRQTPIRLSPPLTPASLPFHVMSSAANRLIGEVVQSRRRHLTSTFTIKTLC